MLWICGELAHVLAGEALDFSSLFVLSKWLFTAVEPDSHRLTLINRHAEALQQSICLRQGVGLFELWAFFLRVPRTLHIEVQSEPSSLLAINLTG